MHGATVKKAEKIFGPWFHEIRNLDLFIERRAVATCVTFRTLKTMQICHITLLYILILISKLKLNVLIRTIMGWTSQYTGRFIMYSGITIIYYRKTLGHIFTKPVQIEGITQIIFSPSKLFFIVVHISATM